MAINPTPASITAGTLDAWEYLASYVDLMTVYGADDAAAANHYNVQGRGEGRSITFNAWAYMASYEDLMNYFGFDAIGAAAHYVVTGRAEGRTITFDAQAYLDANSDLQAAYGNDADGGLSNAAYHYVVVGRTEVANGLRDSGQGGQTFVLTAGVDLFPDGLDNSGNDTIIGEGGTLSPGDDLDGGSGSDVLRYYTDVTLNQAEAAFEVDNVERFQVTADTGATATFDLSGSAGFETFSSFNSTGNVVFQQVTEIPQTVEVQNVTLAGDVTVQIQDTVVAGTADSVNVALMNNYNDGVGVLSIGSMTAANSGIETLNVVTSQAASTVQHLNVDMTTLNLAGDQDLTIVDPLNGFETTVNAGSMTGDLSLDLTDNTTAGVTYTGSQGADTVTFLGTTGDHTIATGAGDDAVIAGMGDDTIDLGEGDDSIDIAPGGLTVLDTINGGAGNDTLTLTGADDIELSEAEQVSDIETFVMTAGGTLLDVTDNMVTSITGPAGGLTVDMGVGGNTVDITDVTFSNTNLLTITGSDGGADLVIADDATINAKATIDFDNDAGDTLRVVNGATITAQDLDNISGMDVMELVSASTLPQTWNIELTEASIGATGEPDLTITISRLVEAGSVLNLDASLVFPTFDVTVLTNSNVTVNVIDPNGVVDVVTALEFTENADNLTGTTDADLFTATSLDQVEAADNADGLGGTDTMQVDYTVNNINRTLEALFDHANIANIEVLEFNTNGDVSFQANRTAAGDFSVGGDYDFDTFTLGGGDDTLFFGGAAAQQRYTVNGRDGNDTIRDNFDWTGDGVLDGANSIITFNGSNGDDNFIFGSDAMMTPADLFAPGAGTDTVTVFDTTEVDVDRGEIAALVTDGELERFVADSDGFVDIFLNNADLYDFTGGVAVFNLDAGTDVFISASSVTDPSESIDVTINAGDDILAVGGAGDDIINILAGETDGDDIGVADDAAGVLGLRGGDTIYLEPAQVENDYVVYKTPQDGGLEGQNGGAGINDMIYNFDVVEDKIVFSKSTIGGLPGLARYTDVDETGDGWMGDTLDKDADDDVDIVINPFGIDLDVDELALYTATGLADPDLLDLATIAGFIAANSSLQNDTVGDVIIFAVQGANDTAIYSFTSENGDADVDVSELAIMAVVHDALLTDENFIYA